MAFPVIQYNASTGSDTAASGAGPATAVTGTNGDISGTTLTLNETVDFTGAADDGSDALWFAGIAGDRHLFAIASFTGGVATCTALVLTQTATAVRNGSNWAVGGLRQTIENDTSNSDWEDTVAGWTLEFDAGTYDYSSALDIKATGADYNTPGIEMRAKSGAASRPILRQTANAYMLQGPANATVRVEGLAFTTNNATKSLTYIYATGSAVMVFRNCTFDANGTQRNLSFSTPSRISVTAIGCHFKGATTIAVYVAGDDSQCELLGCTIDGEGTGCSTAGIVFGGDEGQKSVTNCQIQDCVGVGISVAMDTYSHISVLGNTFVDNAGTGISLSTGVGASADPSSCTVMNNVVAFNGAYGIEVVVGGSHSFYFEIDYNFVYSNTSGNYGGQISAGGDNDVTLTADPFTNRATEDFTLNSTAGGGAAVRSAAFPQTLPDGT